MENYTPFMEFICGAVEGTLSHGDRVAVLNDDKFHDFGVMVGQLSSKDEESTWSFRRALSELLVDSWNQFISPGIPQEEISVEPCEVTKDDLSKSDCWKCIKVIQNTLSNLGKNVDALNKTVKRPDLLDEIFEVHEDGRAKVVKEESKWHKRLPDNFLELASKVDAGEMTQCEAASICGISQPLFRYHMKKALKKAGK